MAKPIASEVDAEPPFSQLRILLTDEVQERYEVARPLLVQQPNVRRSCGSMSAA